MDPQIRYCTASDGVSIAYYDVGEGQPVIHMPGTFTNIHSQWLDLGRRELYARLTSAYRVIRYDRRGCGLSDRTVTDFSIEALTRDLAAVADDLELAHFCIWAPAFSGPTAIAYAADHPARVSKLALYSADAWGGSMLEMGDATLQFLLEHDWELFTEVFARKSFEWPDSERVRAEAASIREAISQETMQRFVEARRSWDVSSLLARVQCPTLVLYRPEWAKRGEEARQNLGAIHETARGIRGAKLVALEGSALAPYVGDFTGLNNLLIEFFGGRPATEDRPDQPAPSGTAIILFADIVDSTALTERMGDAAFRERARSLDASLRTIITGAGGTPIDGKLLGDGVLATFPAAAQAIDAALRCATAGNDGGLPLHLGIHAGDVIREQNNVFGGAVNIASRISGLSAPGEVLVSDVVRALARTSANVTFEDRGEHALKGVGEPQRVYAVQRGA
jgi:class 3 adenylate cyclase/pimeloyl-ACP methyl ester carboxylesterase